MTASRALGGPLPLNLSESVGALLLLLLLLPLWILVDPLDVPDEVGPALGLEVAVSALVRLGQVDLPDVVAQVAEAGGRVVADGAADGLALGAAALPGAAPVDDQVLHLRVLVELDVLALLVGRRARPARGRGAPVHREGYLRHITSHVFACPRTRTDIASGKLKFQIASHLGT